MNPRSPGPLPLIPMKKEPRPRHINPLYIYPWPHCVAPGVLCNFLMVLAKGHLAIIIRTTGLVQLQYWLLIGWDQCKITYYKSYVLSLVHGIQCLASSDLESSWEDNDCMNSYKCSHYPHLETKGQGHSVNLGLRNAPTLQHKVQVILNLNGAHECRYECRWKLRILFLCNASLGITQKAHQ